MSFRLLVTLLVFGLSGTECQSSSAPAWVKQTDTIISQMLPVEASGTESTEQQDSDHDVLPTQRLRPPAVSDSPVLAQLKQSTFDRHVAPQARAPPFLA
ncbi:MULTISPECIES: hypothetical protein [Pseudidiomarina]|uniref:hypothetical protein n=1 Tax=Pseudidiomarina TaxID=2800384 RepID=UPI00215B6FF7|nr:MULTISPECIES: hypothetical protein [Pseudidiomarina]